MIKWSFLLLLFLSTKSFARNHVYRQFCSNTGGYNSVDYCVWKEKLSKNPDVLYYFHGLNGSKEVWWTGDGIGIRHEWQRLQMDPPTVVSLSMGPVWLLVAKNWLPSSGMLEVFLNHSLPKIEKSIGGVWGQRKILGVSMGGFNAIQIYSKEPKIFSKVALVSPAVSSISPFSDHLDILKYIWRTGANFKSVLMAISIAAWHYPDEETWDESGPLALASKVNKDFPLIYMAATLGDCYGFDEGAIRYSKIANRKFKKVHLSQYRANHAQMRPAEVVEFLR